MSITPESETRRLLALAINITTQHTGGHEAVLVAAVFQRLCYETDLASLDAIKYMSEPPH
jgi:phage gp16-like protein